MYSSPLLKFFFRRRIAFSLLYGPSSHKRTETKLPRNNTPTANFVERSVLPLVVERPVALRTLAFRAFSQMARPTVGIILVDANHRVFSPTPAIQEPS